MSTLWHSIRKGKERLKEWKNYRDDDELINDPVANSFLYISRHPSAKAKLRWLNILSSRIF